MKAKLPLTPKQAEDWKKLIFQGAVGVFPTETFYGLGGNALDRDAVKRVFVCKKRPVEKSLLILVKRDWLLDFAIVTEKVACLMDEFWPGALTVILPANRNLPEFLRGPGNTIAVRHSPSKFVDELLGILKKPLIGTSANLSGQPSCQTADEAYRQLGPSVDFWLDGGMTKGGMPSTMLDATEPNFRIIREGAISSEVIRPFL
ncbi:MAG: threonylcarbamoyl-AMP synthase [Proteobacteria bacterium]|nr:MAG: threonylcarbamoyl-AMP synthase [Pseudomonadota bacterium]